MSDIQKAIQWQISVSIIKNSVIVKQLGIAIGLPFGLVILIIGVNSGNSLDTLYALGLIGAMLLFTWLLIMAVYRGKYDTEFLLDDKGAVCRTQAKQARKNRIINTLTAVFGLISGKPAVAGAGILAQSRQEVFLRWSHITKVKYKARSLTILLRGGWTEQIALFCTKENYTHVKQFVMQKTQRLDGVSSE